MRTMIETFAILLLLGFFTIASSALQPGKIETSSRLLSNPSDDVLFTNAELHILLDSVPSTMDEFAQGYLTNVCAAFIQRNLRMPGFGIINFDVIVTGQALLVQGTRNLLRGFRRTSEQEGRSLALNTVVTIEYTHPEGDRVDPADFHRYLRLLMNTRGADFVEDLKRTGVPYFRNTATVLTHSSTIKTQSTAEQSSRSNDQEPQENTAKDGGINAGTIAVVVIAVTAAVILLAVLIIQRLRTQQLKSSRSSCIDQQTPFILEELSNNLDFSQERSNLLEEPTSPNMTQVNDMFFLERPSHLLAIHHQQIIPLNGPESRSIYADLEDLDEKAQEQTKPLASLGTPSTTEDSSFQEYDEQSSEVKLAKASTKSKHTASSETEPEIENATKKTKKPEVRAHSEGEGEGELTPIAEETLRSVVDASLDRLSKPPRHTSPEKKQRRKQRKETPQKEVNAWNTATPIVFTNPVSSTHDNDSMSSISESDSDGEQSI